MDWKFRLGRGNNVTRCFSSSPWEELPFAGGIERKSGAGGNRVVSLDTVPDLHGIFDELFGGRAVIK
jgi:hypothetical protein